MKKIIVTLAVCLLAFAAFELRAQSQELPTLTSAQYASMKKDDVYVIMFSFEGCPPCKLAKSKGNIIRSLVAKYASDPQVHVYVFPVDQDTPAPDGTRLNKRLGVERFPTFVVLSNDTDHLSDSAPLSGYSPDKRANLEKKIVATVSRVK